MSFFLVSYHVIIILFRFGTYDVDHSLNAGLDLEMPGTNKWRTRDYVSRCIQARKLTVATVKQRVKKVLELVQKCAQRAPEVSITIANPHPENSDSTSSRYWMVTAWKGQTIPKKIKFSCVKSHPKPSFFSVMKVIFYL